MPPTPFAFPPIPELTQQEGARWRHRRPSSEQVAAWFETQPLDDDMSHAHYVGGVVIIPGTEKVKYPWQDGYKERWEITYTPYVQIGTRVAYFRRLAEKRGLIPSIKAAVVPRVTNPQSSYFNGNMPDGLWWHCVAGDNGQTARYLCASYTVRMYKEQDYAALLAGKEPMPMLEGSGTKQVTGGMDTNGLMKAQTGAIGRALGVAGMLVVGTGIATAEDMTEWGGLASAAPGDQPVLPPSGVPSEIAPGAQPPPPTDPAEQLAALRAQAMALATKMQESNPESYSQFNLWWQERQSQEGWKTLGDVPLAAMKGVVIRMERLLAEVWPADEPAPNDKTGVAS